MSRIAAILVIVFIGYGIWKYATSDTTSATTETASTGLQPPREVYCKLPTARLADGTSQLHVDYAECMRTSTLPLLATFPPEQQEAYKKSGIIGR